MDIDTLYTDIFNEDKRLNQTNASKVEYLTTMKYVKKYLQKGDKVLDVGAGTGIYSVALAKEGYDVTAVELVKHNLDILRNKITDTMTLKPYLGNALDLSRFEDERFDVVMNLGPLYHLPEEKDRIKAIQESMRVLKKGGIALFAYINNDMVFVTEALSYNPDFLLGEQTQTYNHDSFKVVDKPFTVLTPDYVKALMNKLELEPLKHIACDGYAELLEDKINALTDEQFAQWMRYHYYVCEKRESLGASHHNLYITVKE